AASPAATAIVWTSKPVQRPSTTRIPAPRPWSADCISTKTLTGPGDRASRTATTKNAVSVSTEGGGISDSGRRAERLTGKAHRLSPVLRQAPAEVVRKHDGVVAALLARAVEQRHATMLAQFLD